MKGRIFATILIALARLPLGLAEAQQAKKFEFIINLKAAKQIGPTIPQSTLVQADRLIR